MLPMESAGMQRWEMWGQSVVSSLLETQVLPKFSLGVHGCWGLVHVLHVWSGAPAPVPKLGRGALTPEPCPSPPALHTRRKISSVPAAGRRRRSSGRLRG